MKKIAGKFEESMELLSDFLKLAQNIEAQDPQVSSPSIIVEPTEPIIDRAVKVLQRMDPSYFVGSRKIIVQSSPDYGHVESGPGKDPTVININLNRIKQEAGPEAVVSAALVIAHEVGHVKSFKPEGGFVGGEGPAEAEEKRVENWIRGNLNNIQDLLQL